MPIPRYSSTSSLNQDDPKGHGTGTNDTVYSQDRNISHYRSNPDLSHRPYKQGSISSESADEYFYGVHSRQSSDSSDCNKARRSSAHLSRRTSASVDPLQFVKSKGAIDLAMTAEEQMKLAAETRKIKFEAKEELEDNDWQSNLNSWKNRRKSQSERSYQMKEELEQEERKTENQPTSSAPTKTFSQMKEERERRKSAGNKHFYPIRDEDENDDAFYSHESSTPQERSYLSSSAHDKENKDSNSVKLNKILPEIAPWAEDSGTEHENASVFEDERDNSADMRNKSSSRTSAQLDVNTSKSSTELITDAKHLQTRIPAPRKTGERTSVGTQNSASKENKDNAKAPVSSNKKISSIVGKFEKKDNESVPALQKSVADLGLKKLNWNEEHPTSTQFLAKSSSHQVVVNLNATASSGSSRSSHKDYVEKTIKISQKANNSKGFGFTLTGGTDKQQPVVVEKVGLGSAADVCELKAKDEVVAINKQNISQMTFAQLDQNVRDAVQIGQIELRVKRYLGSGGDDSAEKDDFLSSDDEIDIPERDTSTSIFEEKMKRRGDPAFISSDSGYDAQTFSPSPQRLDVTSSPLKVDVISPPQKVDATSSAPKVDVSVNEDDSLLTQTHSHLHEYEIQRRSSPVSTEYHCDEINVERRIPLEMPQHTVNEVAQNSSKEVQTYLETPVTRQQELEIQQNTDSSFQPPAALKKWQRQRARSEYSFESAEEPKLYNPMRQSAIFPLQSEKMTYENNIHNQNYPVLNKIESKTDTAIGGQPPQMATRKTSSLLHDESKVQTWNNSQEDVKLELKPLEPAEEKTKILEERRAQRQARLKQLSQDTVDSNSVPHLSLNASENTQNQEASKHHTSTLSVQIPSQKISTQPGILIIDPRNCGDNTKQTVEVNLPEQPFQFQVKINHFETPQGLFIRPEIIPSPNLIQLPSNTEIFLEKDLERIERKRQEELQKIEAERRRLEEEEAQRLHSKEEELQRQEKLLQQQKQKLREEQEQLEKERQQLQFKKQAISSQIDIPFYQSSPVVYTEPPVKFDTVISSGRNKSPTYVSTVETGLPQSLGKSQVSSTYSSLANRPHDISSKHSLHQPEPNNIDQNTKLNGSLNKSLDHHLSREDMVAMNKRATPLQSKPFSPTQKYFQEEQLEAVKREPPTKDQLHSLNSVPRAKFRDADKWISSQKDYDEPVSLPYQSSRPEKAQPTASQHSLSSHYPQVHKNQYVTSQDHWLVQEAERRRLNESGDAHRMVPSQIFGPIRPAIDNSNRWRNDPSVPDSRSSSSMPAQIRQTLLQKTATARGSASGSFSKPTPFSSSPGTSSQSSAYTSNYQSRSDVNPPSHRVPEPEHKESRVLSGKQKCSHCSQELGFGAAMVIESLGLLYHVQCFRCCVCHTPLGNGAEGADVRVRVNKLHCPNCYSNDEAGLKFSKV